MTAERIHVDRWSGALAGAVVLAVAGLLNGSTVLVVAAAVPVAFVVYGAVDAVDFDPSMVTVERRLDRESAFPGDRIDVSVSVRNESDRPIPDLRLIDGVPPAVTVVDGRKRGAFSLRPGETESLEYTVVARRGDHEFGPVGLRARSPSGTDVATLEVTPRGSTDLTCRPDLDSVPLDKRTRQFVGKVATDTAGAGVEFHSTREYRSGDPVNRIDWRRLAKTRDLTTVNYREHRSARVVLAVDARDPCYVSAVPGTPTAAAICGYGAQRLAEVLRAEGHEVGAAGFGLTGGTTASGPAWVEPGTGEETRLRCLDVFETATETPRHLRTGANAADWGWPAGAGSRAGRSPHGTAPEGSPGGGRGRAPGVAPDGGNGDRPRDPDRHRGERTGRRPGPDGRHQSGEERRRRGRSPAENGHAPDRRGRERRPPERSGSDGVHHSGGRSHHSAGEGDRGSHRTRGGSNRRRGARTGRGGWRGSSRRSSTEDDVEGLCSRFSPETQLLFLTPALDEFPVTAVRTAVAYGHQVTVVSPDVTTPESTGGRLQDVERHLHLEAMRAAGARVVDWDRNRPLALTLSSVLEGI